MDLSKEIEAVYQRALLLRQRAIESPVQGDLIEIALMELLSVLEELQASQDELRRQNQELIETRQAADLERHRYRTLFEMAPDGYVMTDRQGQIYKANRAAAKMFSIPQEYLFKKPLFVLIHEDDRSRFQSRLADLNRGQEWEMSLVPRQGRVTRVAIAVALIPGGQRQKDALLWSFRDITLRPSGKQPLP